MSAPVKHAASRLGSASDQQAIGLRRRRVLNVSSEKIDISSDGVVDVGALRQRAWEHRSTPVDWTQQSTTFQLTSTSSALRRPAVTSILPPLLTRYRANSAKRNVIVAAAAAAAVARSIVKTYIR